jgi:hypothetical protein
VSAWNGLRAAAARDLDAARQGLVAVVLAAVGPVLAAEARLACVAQPHARDRLAELPPEGKKSPTENSNAAAELKYIQACRSRG